MKKSSYIIFLIIISVVYSACTSSTAVDETIGKHTFELLQKLDTISKEDFSNYFISLEELREFVKDTAVQDDFRNAMTTISKEKHQERLLQSYEMLKESGETNQIDWSKITYDNYLYQLRLDNGVTFHDGFVIFYHDSQKYLAKVISLEYEEKPRLFILSNFEVVTK